MDKSNNDVTSTYDQSTDSKVFFTSAYDTSQTKQTTFNHGLTIGERIKLQNTEYTIISEISKGTSEAVIYKIQNNEMQFFALKLYREFSNIKEEPNPETLKRIKEIDDPNILRLHYYGIGADRYKDKYCFEISEFASGKDLLSVENFKSKYTAKFLEEKVVPSIIKGIQKLHDNYIIHCDLKPQNIFYLDENQTNIAIGDYGSSKSRNSKSDQFFSVTEFVKFTNVYMAVELGQGSISEKADYYSFGMTLLHLLYPEQFAKDGDPKSVDNEKRKKITIRQMAAMPVVDYDRKFERLNNLIGGLTLLVPENRFGKAEVQKWMKGESLKIKYRSDVRPVKLSGDSEIWTPEDLIKILENSTTWWNDIFLDNITYLNLLNWLGDYQNAEKRKIFNEMIEYYKNIGEDYVKEATIRFFDQNKSIKINENIYNFATAEDLYDEVALYISKIDDVWKNSTQSEIVFYIFQMEFALKQIFADCKHNERKVLLAAIIDKLLAVFDLITKSFDDYKTEIQRRLLHATDHDYISKTLKLFYEFAPNRTYRDLDNKSIRDIKSLGTYYLADKDKYLNKFQIAEKNEYLTRIKRMDLLELSFTDFVFKVFEKEKNVDVKFLQFVILSDRSYQIRYAISESLSRLLESKKIDGVVEREIREFKVEAKYNLFSSSHNLYLKTLSAIKKQHTLNDSSFNDNVLRKFEKKFRSAYHVEWKVLQMLILLPTSFALGIVIYYVIQNLLNQSYNVSLGLNVYFSYTNLLASGISGALFTYFILLFRSKLKLRKILSCLLLLFLLVFLLIDLNKKYDVFKMTKEYQHKFYIESFNPILINKFKEVDHRQLNDLFNAQFPPTEWVENVQYTCKIDGKLRKQGFSISSDVAIIKGELHDPGFGREYVLNYSEVESYRYADQISLGIFSFNEPELLKNSYSVQLKSNLMDNNSSIGIRIGILRIKIDTNKIYVLEEDPNYIREHFLDNNTFYYLLSYFSNSSSFTESRYIGFTEPTLNSYNTGIMRPYGMTSIPTFCKVLFEERISLDNENKVSLQVSVSRNQIQLKLNDSLIKNFEFKLTDHNISILFGLKSNILINDLAINQVADNRTLEKANPDILKPIIPFESELPLYSNISDENQIKPKPSEDFEVLYEKNNYYMVKSTLDFNTYYIPKGKVNTVILR